MGDGPDLVLSSAVPASDNHIYGWMWVVPTAMPFKAYDIEQDADRVRAKVVANCDTGNGTELQTAISNYFDIIRKFLRGLCTHVVDQLFLKLNALICHPQMK